MAMSNTPLKFTLKSFMLEKYGEDRFNLACKITAQWLQFETGNKKYTMKWIKLMANCPEKKDFELLPAPAAALCKLYGLTDPADLYN
jgi:hypothetical protein